MSGGGIYPYVQPDGTWWISSTGFGPQGVISIGSCSTQRRTQACQAAIAEVTPAPVRTVVNTHHHGDHTFGSCLFPGAAARSPPGERAAGEVPPSGRLTTAQAALIQWPPGRLADSLRGRGMNAQRGGVCW